MASTIRGCYRISPVDGNLYPVEIAVGQSFGEPQHFPADFMFQLTSGEAISLRSQIATSKQGRGGRRYRPYAFTEHGAIMAASVLNSHRAIEVSVYVLRAFVKLREMLRTHKELARKLAELEKRIAGHDEEIIVLFEAIRQLMEPPEKTSKRIGFHG
jgi:hypothetical protein